MSYDHAIVQKDAESMYEMLSVSGYSDTAIDYYVNKPNMGSLPGADQITELTGHCGDTMKVYLKLEQGIIKDARFQVLGCPGAVAAAMAIIDVIKGKTIKQALTINDRDIFRKLEEIPDQKQHCIRLAVKTLQKAIEEYTSKNGEKL